MPSIVTFLLLCALVTSGRTESLSNSHLQSRRAAFSSPSGDGFGLSPQSALPGHVKPQSSSSVERLTLMDVNVPELSALSSDEDEREGEMNLAGPSTPNMRPKSMGESSIDAPTKPTTTPEPNEALSTSLDFNGLNAEGLPTPTPQASQSESRAPPGIHFRRFNSDGSLATDSASQTKTPEPIPDPLGDFIASLEEETPSKTQEPEMDGVPESSETSEEEAPSAIVMDKDPFVGPVPESSPLVSPSPEILEIDAEEIALATESDIQRPDESNPRASVFVSGPVTSSVTWNKGEPPVFSFSTSNDNEADKGKSDELDEGQSDEKEADEEKSDESDDNISDTGEEATVDEVESTTEFGIEPSSEPEIDVEGKRTNAMGWLLPKSPGRPKPSDTNPPPSPTSTQTPTIVIDFPMNPMDTIPIQDAGNADGSPSSTDMTSSDANGQKGRGPFDVVAPENFSSFPKPPNTEEEGTDWNFSGEDTTEDFIEASPVAVFSDFFDVSSILGDHKGSTDPEFSAEPEASEESPLPSEEPDLISIALVVRHPPSFGPEELAEEIRLNSNEFIVPEEWEIVSVFQLSQLSKFASDDVDQTDPQKNAPEDGHIAFELVMEARCAAEVDCVAKLEENKKFIRDGNMDQTLAAHDFSRVSVFLEGEMTERTNPLSAVATPGLGVGLIAGIAVGGIAIISLVVLLAVVAANMRSRSQANASSGYDSELEFEDDVGPDQEFPLEQGSFMISNFGGTPRNSNAMIPWLNDSSSGSGHGSGHGRNARSFISVDSMTPNDPNRMSQYRFDETKSSVSGSESGEVVQVVGPEESGSTVYAVQ